MNSNISLISLINDILFWIVFVSLFAILLGQYLGLDMIDTSYITPSKKKIATLLMKYGLGCLILAVIVKLLLLLIYS